VPHPHTPQKRSFTAVVIREDDWYVAQCIEVDVASQGPTVDAAVDALREALELRFEGEELPAPPEVRRFEIAV
jgi:predicted RNase H-like HicB family nuclease